VQKNQHAQQHIFESGLIQMLVNNTEY